LRARQAERSTRGGILLGKDAVANLAADGQRIDVEIAACFRGDHDAALRAKRMGGDLVARHRPAEAPLVMVASSSLDIDDYVDFDAYDNFGMISDTRP
jgi:hypothetical protein